MKKLTYISVLTLFFLGCETEIKNTQAKVQVEEGTEIEGQTPSNHTLVKNQQINLQISENQYLGTWVGYFKEDTEENFSNKGIYVDEGFYWTRENKINISIDKVTDSLVFGHSVVAGNNRPFKGKLQNGVFTLREPGDDQYDGVFTFQISKGELTGKWTAYKDIDIKNRKYTLEKKHFVYNPDIMLEKSKKYVDWFTFTEEESDVEMDQDEFEEWVKREFASATDFIYTINASNTLLTKNEVENLKKGDLTIIRNTIYARHGYSFKNRPLRVFFDAQKWYIPIHTDIKSEFTNIEKENIQLLLRYEKNAVEYYDYFGRG